MIDYTTYDIEALPDMITAGQLIDFLGVSKTTVYKMMSDTYFPSIQLGRRKLVLKQDFITWINKRKQTAYIGFR